MHPTTGFRKLPLYQRVLALAAVLDKVAGHIPSRRPDLRDQLERASASILLNLAEGASEFSPKEKARFYRMARRSAAECGAIVDLLVLLEPATGDILQAQQELTEVGAILTSMIRVAEARLSTR